MSRQLDQSIIDVDAIMKARYTPHSQHVTQGSNMLPSIHSRAQPARHARGLQENDLQWDFPIHNKPPVIQDEHQYGMNTRQYARDNYKPVLLAQMDNFGVVPAPDMNNTQYSMWTP